MRSDQEGDVWVEKNGTRYEGHWRLADGLLSLYV